MIMLVLLLIARLVYCNTIIVNVNEFGSDTQDCLEGVYPCSSLGYVLNHLQSNDCVNITSNSVPLTTIVELHNLNAITIRGQGNTIVMCNNTGGVSCNNCSNVVIEGITWDGCGDPQKQEPRGGVYFNQLANLFIKNCTFKHSKLRALCLLNISGLLKIINTDFLFNSDHSVIDCFQAQTGFKHCTTPNFTATGAVMFNESTGDTIIDIQNCNFNNNGHMGKVNDIEYKILLPEALEIARGSGLMLQSYNLNSQVNISIEKTCFSSNRGHGGAGVFIMIKSCSFVALKQVTFHNNTLVKEYSTASALWVSIDSKLQPKLSLSSCDFHSNRIGRNMIRLHVMGSLSSLHFEHCDFINNSNHSVTVIELSTKSQSVTEFIKSSFIYNQQSALLLVHLHHANSTITVNGANVSNNAGYFLQKTGGFIILKLYAVENSSANLKGLNFVRNHFSGSITGGGIYIHGTFQLGFKCHIQASKFYDNIGFGSGAVLHTSLASVSVLESSFIISIDDCIFINNTGDSIVYIAMDYYVIPAFLILNGDFINNKGNPLKLVNIILVGKGNSIIKNNQAKTGAALHLSNSYILLNYFSFQFNIVNNHADLFGGGIFVDFSMSSLDHSQCHWLLFSEELFCEQYKHVYYNCTTRIITETFCNEFSRSEYAISVVQLINNTALLSGSAIFYDSIENIKLSNRSMSNPASIFYIPKSFIIYPNSTQSLMLSTHPERLQLFDPAKCNANFTTCNITDIMLGQEIEIQAYIIGYNDQPAEVTVFFIECIKNCYNYSVSGEPFVLIRNKLRGISIFGSKVNQTNSLSMKLNSSVISLTLNVILVPCHLGYVYIKSSKECECYYSPKNIVMCKRKMTTIKKDYWFGSVEGTTSVSRCPNKYCNFTRREVSPGRFLLPSAFDDQCGLHRTGLACGRCSNGYTLSYEFDYCIDIKDCTPGITALVVVCTVLYWIIVIVVVLGVMYFKINMGYLYGIIYYYSILDILLGDVWNYSEGLMTVSKALISIVRLSPTFLGRLCFVKGMSGIDQYALYYIHPTSIALILVVLAVFARCSRRFSVFISRGIIHAICLILVLTYTSISHISLLLLRPLRFTGSRQLYCFLTPEIKYFTGRHIAYGTIAFLYELAIVSSLPLLLLLEPFVNHRINFTRIKPLLDQFQGCFKDNYRWFASIYLLCRQFILIAVVLNYLDDYATLFVLVSLCLALIFTHSTIQPYKAEALNKFDSLVLSLLVMVTCLQMVVLSESTSFTSDAVIGIAYSLIFVPLLVCIVSLFCVQRKFLLHFVRCLMYKITLCLRKQLHLSPEVHPSPLSTYLNCPLCGHANMR